MKKFSLTICVLAIALAIVGLVAAVVWVSAGTVVHMSDHGKVIRVKTGQVFELALKEQAGTGYIWQFHQFDSRHFQVLHTDTKSLAEPGRLGGPVLHVWQIKALAPGVARLSLDCLRPWEGRTRAAEHFEITVHIQ